MSPNQLSLSEREEEERGRRAVLRETFPAILFCLFVLASVFVMIFWLVVISPQGGSIQK